MDEQIRAQIEIQSQQQIQIQIKEYLPTSLQQQSEECKGQIKELEWSLKNSSVHFGVCCITSSFTKRICFSAARRSNARLPVTDLDEPLRVVLKADGTRSRWFPANLKSLCAYDGL